MEITVLIENTGCPALAREHGLAVHIAYRGHSILLDTGSSGAFAENARSLGVDLAQVELGVLSHGHYDHADGLRAFFQANSRAPMYIRKGALGAYYSMRGGAPKFVGVHRDICRDWAGRFVEVEGVYPLMEGAWLVPDPAPEQDARRAQHLYEKVGEDQFRQDTFTHEHSLVLEGERGLVVFNSCCHAGASNIAGHIARTFPGKPLAALVGGFHMMGSTGTDSINCGEDYVFGVADTLRELGVGQIYTGHCTGEPAFALLRERFGAGCHALATGQKLTL